MNPTITRRLVIAVCVVLATLVLPLATWSLDSLANSTVVLNVKDFSARGDGVTDDSLAFSSALKMLAGTGGTLVVPWGLYLVGELKVGSDTTLKGTGVPRPVLVKAPNAANILDLSGEVLAGRRREVRNVTIESLILRGRSVEDGFREHVHNMIAIGVKTLVVNDVTFEAFQGDGLYLGSRISPVEPVSHNSEVIVVNSEFKGTNSQNRNGISIIDCDRCIVEHNMFSNLSRRGMPGPIDIEPNQLDEIIENIIVRNNTIRRTNGGAGVSVSLRTGAFQRSPVFITLENNSIQQAKIGILILRSAMRRAKGQPPGVSVRNNIVQGTVSPLLIDGSSSITVSGNVFSDSTGSVGIGCASRSGISFTGNVLKKVGSQSGSGIQLCGQLSSINFQHNTFSDTGSAANESSAIYITSGVMNGISFLDNTFSSPLHITRIALRLGGTARVVDTKLVWAGNILNDGIQREEH
jgi:hypothetical protein